MPVWLLALILGLIEGITEFIPVSSTGHLLIAENLLGVHETAPFLRTELFNAFIQVWAMLAALPLFRERLATLARWREPKCRDYFIKLFVAFVITGVGGLAMKKAGLELPNTALPVVAALFVGGVLFVAVEWWLRGRPRQEEITWAVAIAIGVAQLAAIAFPGTSRSGSTILVALMLGMARPVATEFSFLLGVPTLCAAGAKTLYDALKAGETIDWTALTIASIASAISSVLAVRWLLGFVRTHTFVGFGWYRIILAAVLLGLYFIGWLH
jgi:undecaprenyl-diphosphatase